ncbi:MAG: hypothetical protein NXI20_21085 [bacterium]|nr:hypothetical protein [bacterium]
MARFDNIDLILDDVARQFKVKLSKDRSEAPGGLRIEERGLDWS